MMQAVSYSEFLAVFPYEQHSVLFSVKNTDKHTLTFKKKINKSPWSPENRN